MPHFNGVGQMSPGFGAGRLGHMYVSNYGSGTVSRIAIATGTVDATITVGSSPVLLALAY